jgi:hypothetical protein
MIDAMETPAAADQQLGLGVRGGAAALLVFGVFVLAAWITISSGSAAPAVREAGPAVREQLLTSLYARGRPAVAVFVLANDPHRAAVCTAPGQTRFLQEDGGRWQDEGRATPTAWAQTLIGACPYVP